LPVRSPLRIFHITAIPNLARIAKSKMLLANTLLQKKKLPHANIAYQGAQGKRATKLVAKPPGGVIHAPFGEPYAQAGAIDLSFTGQNQDTVSGEYDFLAREYSMQGRWPSPDPAGLDAVDPSNPQSRSRYSYVINDPLDYIDPDGLFYGPPCGAFDDACSEPGPPQPFPPCIQAPEQSCGPTAPTDPGHPNPPSSGGNTSGTTAAKACVQPSTFQGIGIAFQRAVASFTGSTFGVGAGGTFAGGNRIGVTLAVSRQVVVSPNGQAAFVTTVTPLSPTAFNSYVSPGVSGYSGFQVSFSNAATPRDLGGPALDLGYGGGRGWGGGGDLSVGWSGNGPVIQGTLTFPAGGGAPAATGHGLAPTITSVTPICR